MNKRLDLLFPLSQGRKWGVGSYDRKLIILKSRLRPIGYGRAGYGGKERIWQAIPYPEAAPRYTTKTELLRELRRKSIRLTKSARAELSELPERYVDWPSWYQDLD